MATLSGVRTRIASKLSDGELVRPSSAQITAAINSTIDYYERRYFWFQQGTDTLTTSSDSYFIYDSDLPSDFEFQQHPNALVLQKNSYFYPIHHVEPIKFDLMRNTVSNSYPQYYTYRSSNIELYPTPDEAYSVNLYYFKNFSDLSGDTETNVFLDNAERLVEYKTMLDLLEDYKDDDRRIPTYQKKVKDEERNIYNETYNRTCTGELSTENIAKYDFMNDYFFRRNY